MKLLAILMLAAITLVGQPASENAEGRLRRALQTKTGTVKLPAGTIEISREIILPADAYDLDIGGSGTTIKASAAFRGGALLVLPAGKNIKIHDLSLDGNRAAFPEPVSAPSANAPLLRVVANNGILAEGVTGLEIAQLKATEIAGFPILVNSGRDVRIHDIEITSSGMLDANGRNNGTGGIALEEGVNNFEIARALIGKVRGRGIWIRSVGGASSSKGRITDSEFAIVARTAIEMNHATGVTIENNHIHLIGFPGEETIVTEAIVPSGIATTGAVDHAVIRNNDFEQITGRCFSLDGFSNSEVTSNQCSDLLFNAFLIRGTGNKITGNHMSGVNTARRDQPESLRAGVYFAAGASGNLIDGNDLSGYGMSGHCVGGPGMAANKVATNICSDGPSVARLIYDSQPATPR